MKIILGVPTYKRFDLCAQMIESARAGTRPPDAVMVVDNSGEGLWNGDVDILIQADSNLGVARGWNAMIEYVIEHEPGAYLLIVNDDILLHDDTIERFEQELRMLQTSDEVEPLVLCSDGLDALNAFSMFMIQPVRFVESVGYFDGTFYPAYFEDGDMYRRMRLAGYDLYRVPACGASHQEGGSATIKSYDAEASARHHLQFQRNQAYYLMKWGGLTHEEKFTSPFNGRDLMKVMQYIYQQFGY